MCLPSPEVLLRLKESIKGSTGVLRWGQDGLSFVFANVVVEKLDGCGVIALHFHETAS